MFKKRFITAALSAILAVSVLAGCGGSGDTEGSDAQSGTESATTAKAGDSATGKTDLADAGFDTSYEPKKDSYKIYCTYKTSIAGMTP